MKEEKPVIIQSECLAKGKATCFLIGLLTGAVIVIVAFVAFMLVSGRPGQPQMPMQGGNAPQMQQMPGGQVGPEGRNGRDRRPPKLDDESEKDEDQFIVAAIAIMVV